MLYATRFAFTTDTDLELLYVTIAFRSAYFQPTQALGLPVIQIMPTTHLAVPLELSVVYP